jgi:PAS domain S-box-containing protein
MVMDSPSQPASPPTTPASAPARPAAAWQRRLPLALTAAAGLALALGLFLLVRQADERRWQAEFQRQANVPATALQRDIDDYVYLLRSIGAFYFSSQDVDRREFRGFTENALSRLSGISALEWIPRVSDPERPAHEQAARQQGLAEYQITERDSQGRALRAARRGEYFPIYYAEPASQRGDLGLDLALDADSVAAMTKARDRDTAIAGPPSRQQPGTNQTWACRIFVAVFTNLVPHESIVDRYRNLAGYAAGVIDLDRLVGATMEKLGEADARAIEWQLLDDSIAAEMPIVLHQSPAWDAEAQAVGEIPVTFRFEVASRRWLLLCQPTAAYLSAHRSWRGWGLLGGGVLVTALLTAYLSSMLGRAAQVERLVVERTAELAQSNRELMAEVAQRERMEAALAAERDLVGALLDNIPDHIYFKDRQSHFLRINKAMAALFTLRSPDEAVGKSDFDFFTAEHAQRAFDDEQEILRTGQPLIGREEKETWPDGSITWVSTTKQCLRDKAGHVVGTFGISRDITARKQAERRLAVQYLVATVLAEAATFNAAAPHILQEVCECLGWSVGAIWTVDKQAKVLRCMELWHAPSVNIPEFEAVSRRTAFPLGLGLPGRVWASGEPAWIRDVVTDPNFPRAPLATKEGLHAAFGFPIRAGTEVLGIIEFFSPRIEQPDQELLQLFAAVGSQIGQFVERKRMEQALARKAQELERSNDDLEQFAYVASHDLQEPLRMIASYTQLLERRYKDKLDADARDFISFAADGATRMQTLINDLLAYSRVGTQAKAFAVVDCSEVLKRALKNLEIAIEESRARITAADLPRVIGDATQLTQLFQNLLGNAIKFRGDKPAVAHVSAELKKHGAAREWQFAVRDEGIGIEPKYFERIFIIFQRLHTRDQYPGTGIGLAVCKKIVERHGGRIRLESEGGKGTAFYFTLPAAE